MKCPECHCYPSGHKINCKTGNDRAAAYQSTLRRRRPVPGSEVLEYWQVEVWTKRMGWAEEGARLKTIATAYEYLAACTRMYQGHPVRLIHILERRREIKGNGLQPPNNQAHGAPLTDGASHR